MRRAIIKGCLLGLIFMAALVLISTVMNQDNTNMTAEMGEATFPVVSMSVAGYRVNDLHGYAQNMDCAYLRDTLQPVESDRKIAVTLETYGRDIAQIAFEVRSLDGERLVESTQVADFEQEDSVIRFDITLKDLIEYDTEYMLVFLVTPQDSVQLRYYTRIVLSESMHMQDKLDYIMDFHERTFDKEEAAELTKYLESNAEGDNTTFQKVTIHSSFDQVTWGDLEAERITEPSVLIKELTEQTGAFDIEYLAAVREGRQTNRYRVREYYRIRYTPDRMYLLDFEREMNQIFDEEADIFVNDKIMLGIVGDEVKIHESDGGNVFAFVAADKLYSYNVTDNKLARLFSFYENTEGVTDPRNIYDRHNIQILSVDETGNVYFMVYGYMNRGRHEGSVGVAVYFYNSMTNTVEEKIYIPYGKSYELLKSNINRLSYVNRVNVYYFMMNDSVYAVNLETEVCQIIARGLRDGSYHVSDSNKMLVWQEGDGEYAGSRLVLLNLNTQSKTSIEAGEGEYISILGFMEEDMIYGLTKQSDIVESSTGEVMLPMYCVRIQSENGDVLKTYDKEGVYVSGSRIEENQITLSRVVWNEETQEYEETTEDQIMSTEQARVGVNTIGKVVTETYETISQITVKNEIDVKSLKRLTPREVLFEGNHNVAVEEPGETQPRYYVYGKNGIEGIYANPGKAVALAYSAAGVVVDDDGGYVWRRENRSARNQIMAITEDEMSETRSSLAVCLDTILKFEGISRNTQRLLENGSTIFSILETDLQENTILDLTGCSLDTVLYYVNKDIPVLALLEDGNAVLIVGFNELNIVVMDPMTGTLYKKGMNDSTEWLNENGNRFITYVRKK